MKRILKAALVCAATIVSIMAVSCEKTKPEPQSKPEFDIEFTAENGDVKAYCGESQVTKACEGDVIKVVAIPAREYTFGKWSGNVDFDNPESDNASFTMPARKADITATFNAIPVETCAITISNEVKHGSIQVIVDGNQITSGDKVAAGKSVTISAMSDAGYVFSSWNVTGVEITDQSGYASFVMPKNEVAVSATFEEVVVQWVQIGDLKWAKYNLGAPGQFVEKETDLGMLYQFGKGIGWDGANPTPVDGEFYLGSNGWGTPQEPNNNDWLLTPCPQGYRMPTDVEWTALAEACTLVEDTRDGVKGCTLSPTSGEGSIFLPYAGNNVSGSRPVGVPNYVGEEGWYWTANPVTWSGKPGPPPMAVVRQIKAGIVTKTNTIRHGLCSLRCVVVE